MLPRLRSLVGLIAWITFTANSFVPGLLHRCDAASATAQPAMAECDHGDMTAMAGHTVEPSGHHPAHSGTPEPPGDCHCIGHSCCSGALALPARSVAMAPVAAALPRAALRVFITAPVSRRLHLLPFAQAPPLLA